MLGLLIRACDLSDQTKEWRDSKEIAARLYEEFFSEGDEYKEKKGENPTNAITDRERAYIPDLQLNFLDSFALPIFS